MYTVLLPVWQPQKGNKQNEKNAYTHHTLSVQQSMN